MPPAFAILQVTARKRPLPDSHVGRAPLWSLDFNLTLSAAIGSVPLNLRLRTPLSIFYVVLGTVVCIRFPLGTSVHLTLLILSVKPQQDFCLFKISHSRFLNVLIPLRMQLNNLEVSFPSHLRVVAVNLFMILPLIYGGHAQK